MSKMLFIQGHGHITFLSQVKSLEATPESTLGPTADRKGLESARLLSMFSYK